MITEYKTYTIIKGHDWYYHIYDGKKFIVSAPTYRLAQETILKIIKIKRKEVNK